MSIRFEGILPPVTTPFSTRGEIQLSSLESNLERYLENGVSGFLLLGSNGEAPHLSEDEKLKVVDCACRTVGGRRPIIVGLSAASLREALNTAESLGRFAIDALLVSAPNYYKNRMTDQALEGFFTAIADASRVPLLVYNVPQYAGIRISSRLLGSIAAHPKIIGMKDSSGDLGYLQSVKAAVEGASFQIMLGSAQVLGPALSLGVRAAILAVACAFPELPQRLLKTHLEGGSIESLQSELYEIAMPLTSRFGVAAVKYAMDRAGFDGGQCRLPLLPLSDGEEQEIETILRSARLTGQLLVQPQG